MSIVVPSHTFLSSSSASLIADLASIVLPMCSDSCVTYVPGPYRGRPRTRGSAPPAGLLYHGDLAKDYQSFRKELERLRGQLDSADVLRIIDTLIRQLDHEREENSRKLSRLSENVRS